MTSTNTQSVYRLLIQQNKIRNKTGLSTKLRKLPKQIQKITKQMKFKPNIANLCIIRFSPRLVISIFFSKDFREQFLLETCDNPSSAIRRLGRCEHGTMSQNYVSLRKR